MTLLTTKIPHSRLDLGQDDIRAVLHVLESGQVAKGPVVDQFERSMAAFVGVKGGVALSSGTASLEVALRAMGIGTGDEVIMPSYVCAAPWLATVRVGAQPQLVDIQLESFSIDPEKVEETRSAKTRALIVPHLFGLPADMRALEALDIPIIEDCAQTLAATAEGRPVGSIGSLAICSFYATKLLCAGEGGMVLSSDETLLERAKALREYDEKPGLEPASFNYKLTDLQAALGLNQLHRIQSFLDRRASIAAYYHLRLREQDLVLPAVPEGRTHIYYRFVVRIPRFRGNREGLARLVGRLEHRGVQCRRPVFRPLHQHLSLEGFPRTEEASETALSLPIYSSMTDEEVERTAQALIEELA